MTDRRKQRWGRDGCGFLIATCLFTCCFLVINGMLVVTFYAWLAPLGPEFLRNPKTAQAVLFAAPVLLLLVEWWVADYLVDRLTS